MSEWNKYIIHFKDGTTRTGAGECVFEAVSMLGYGSGIFERIDHVEEISVTRWRHDF